jgi:predicted RND superfamily exporter protein
MNRYVQTQISSLASSSVAVGLIVAALMKSVLLGILSLVPLFFTVLINFGLMGYAGLPLDAVTSIIAGVVIGLGVDYAIHYISRYRLERANGHQMEQALLNTGVSAGRGIFFNALALVIGFMVLVFSHFRAIAVFGFLISVTMVVSSFAALVVIPLLLQYFDRKKVQVERSM